MSHILRYLVVDDIHSVVSLDQGVGYVRPLIDLRDDHTGLSLALGFEGRCSCETHGWTNNDSYVWLAGQDPIVRFTSEGLEVT